MKLSDTTTAKGYIGTGRTTALVVRNTGVVLGSWIGILTRSDCWNNYLRDELRAIAATTARTV